MTAVKGTPIVLSPDTVSHVGVVRPGNHKLHLNSASYVTNYNVLNCCNPSVALIDVSYESGTRWLFANLPTLDPFRVSRI